MMGAGKTTVGKRLAAILDYSFIDTDQVIEQRLSRSVTEVFTELGEKYWRDQERRLLQEIVTAERQVIAVGGGMLLPQANSDLAIVNGLVIYLHASVEELAQRLENNSGRPLLTGTNPQTRLNKIYQARKDHYRSVTHRIDTTEIDPEETARQVAVMYKEWLSQ